MSEILGFFELSDSQVNHIIKKILLVWFQKILVCLHMLFYCICEAI